MQLRAGYSVVRDAWRVLRRLAILVWKIEKRSMMKIIRGPDECSEAILQRIAKL